MPRRFPVVNQPSEEEGVSYNLRVDHLTGVTLVVGDTVFLSDAGVEVLASSDGSYDAVNAYSFIDEDQNEIGGMYGRDDSGQNVVGFRVVDEAGNNDDAVLEIAATSTTSATASVAIQANRTGESTDTYMTMERSGSASEIDIMTTAASGRIRLKPRINLLGANNEIVDIYIKNTYFILKYYDSGTWRYKYLDLSGTGTTWSNSTSEP